MVQLDRTFHALADSTRRAVIARLSAGPASVSELAQNHAMALPSFLKHLQVLETSDIITSQKVGRVRMCRLRAQTLTVAESWLEQARQVWEIRLDQLDSLVTAMAEKDQADGL